jgi:hypothetical protein
MEINHKRIFKVYTKYFLILIIKNIAASYILVLCLTNLKKCETISDNYCTHVRTTKFPATNFPQYCCALNFG